ncbi:cytochrome c [Geotalea sp. SG265]|uniref:c-type cytochrome n=1 Tax=Geotalea sp. SG265 TaxID=2922867 RepID=UPI001FAF1AE0|nr:cytochrome c [Geotalea sp. SG265]
MRYMTLAVMAVLLLCACGTPRRGENIAGPLTLSTEKEVRGEKYFMTYCNKCHPLGESGVGFALNNKPLTGPLIRTQVRFGAGAMPAFSKEFLPDEKLDDILAYLQVLREH